MGIDIAVVGTEIVQQYWHKRRLCSEILKTVYSMGIMSKHDWTKQYNTQFSQCYIHTGLGISSSKLIYFSRAPNFSIKNDFHLYFFEEPLDLLKNIF